MIYQKYSDLVYYLFIVSEKSGFFWLNNLISSIITQNDCIWKQNWKMFNFVLLKEVNLIINIMCRTKFIPIEVFNCSINQINLGFIKIPFLLGIRQKMFCFQIKSGLDNDDCILSGYWNELHCSFLGARFHMESYSQRFKLDRTDKGGGIMLYNQPVVSLYNTLQWK